MKKIIYYINTLSQLTILQVFFLGYNKVIKRKLAPFLLKRIPIESQFVSYIYFKDRIKRLLGDPSIWEIGVDNNYFQRNYYLELKQNLREYINSGSVDILIKYWNEKCYDIEINYNYQRFYLFSYAFEELEMSHELRIKLLLSWIRHSSNFDLAWSGFNCAMRLINWVRILDKIEPKNLKDDDWKMIQESIQRQQVFNYRNIEKHIPGNHILLQYYSLWLIAILLENGKKENQTKEILNQLVNEINNEFLPTGIHFELSTHYHLQTTLIIVYLINHLQNLNRVVPKDLIELSLRANQVIDSISIGNYYPIIGDACYNFFHENKYDDLRNLKELSRRLHVLSNVKDKYNNYDNKYFVINDHDFQFLFDVSEIGYRYNSGHGHADALSFILGYNKVPIFIDPGVRRYSNLSEDLKYKRTQNHNTVSIGNCDQSVLWGFFRWAFPYKIISSRLSCYNIGTYTLEGTVKGYKEIGGITHRRKIEVDQNSVLIEDFVFANSKNFIQINFILHPQIKASIENQKVILSTKENGFLLESLNEQQLKPSILSQDFYDEYDLVGRSNKIIFVSNKKADKFHSKILLRVID